MTIDLAKGKDMIYLISFAVNNNPEAFKQLLSQNGVQPVEINSNAKVIQFLVNLYRTSGAPAVKAYFDKVPYNNYAQNYTGGALAQGVPAPETGRFIDDVNDTLNSIGNMSGIFASLFGGGNASNAAPLPPPTPPSWWEVNADWVTSVIIVVVIIFGVIFTYKTFFKKK